MAPDTSPASVSSGAWLAMAVGGRTQHGGNDGYEDLAESAYSWDSTVPNHGNTQVGDAIVLWDKTTLLGASVIERIDEWRSTKWIYSCPHCNRSGIKRRKKKRPLYHCYECKSEFDEPSRELVDTTIYRSQHGAAWVELAGVLTGPELRALCHSPHSQLSLRPLRWDKFSAAIESSPAGEPLTLLQAAASQIRGGHKLTTVRVRKGQQAFRRQLLQDYGAVCAISGPAPASTLEAAHLYSYASIGEHHDGGGLLLRRDIHRLFDLGHLAIEPSTLSIHVGSSLRAYPMYANLNGAALNVDVTETQLLWFAAHWGQHQATHGAGRAKTPKSAPSALGLPRGTLTQQDPSWAARMIRR